MSDAGVRLHMLRRAPVILENDCQYGLVNYYRDVHSVEKDAIFVKGIREELISSRLTLIARIETW